MPRYLISKFPTNDNINTTEKTMKIERNAASKIFWRSDKPSAFFNHSDTLDI